MARYLPEILPDLLKDGNPIKAETEKTKIYQQKQNTIKIKKVYPRLPDIWGKKDTPYYICIV